MGMLRTAVAFGALTLSVPALAQSGRNGTDRTRAERGRDARSNNSRGDNRSGARVDTRGESRASARPDVRPGARPDVRNDGRNDARSGARYETRGAGVPDVRGGRRDEPRAAPRPETRAPVIDRRSRIDVRINRYDPYARRGSYRYNDRDFRHRDVLSITAWFRDRGYSRWSMYGRRDRVVYIDRNVFRPGLFLSLSLFPRLDILPFDLELRLGELPWYLERRIYGRTVLIIDTRSRLIVDAYDIDW